MVKLDIRTMVTDNVDTIVFSDKTSTVMDDYSCSMLQEADGQSIVFSDVDGDKVSRLRIDDIDNFILALQKAKELWEDLNADEEQMF